MNSNVYWCSSIKVLRSVNRSRYWIKYCSKPDKHGSLQPGKSSISGCNIWHNKTTLSARSHNHHFFSHLLCHLADKVVLLCQMLHPEIEDLPGCNAPCLSGFEQYLIQSRDLFTDLRTLIDGHQ